MTLLDEFEGWTLLDEAPLYALDGLLLGACDPDGVAWVVRSESGWSASAPASAAVQDREDADGAWPAPTRYSARTITLEGTAVAPSRLLMVTAKDRFNACAAGPSTATLRVSEAHLTRQAVVQRNGSGAVTDRGIVAFEWGLQLVATDPLRYADAAVTASADLSGLASTGRTYPRRYPLIYDSGSEATRGIVSVVNEGNAATGGIIRLRGPVTNPTVTHLPTGRVIAVNVTIPNGSVVEIDLDKHTVVLDGAVSRRSFTSPAQWWLHEAGTTRLRLSGGLPSPPTPPAVPYPAMDVTYRSAWR